MDATAMSVVFRTFRSSLVLCNRSNNNKILFSKHDESPLYMPVCWIIEPLVAVAQRSKTTCPGGAQFGNAKGHDECSLSILLFIVVDYCFFGLSSMEGSYGYALDVMESCCFKG
jgi:hypothetical protein